MKWKIVLTILLFPALATAQDTIDRFEYWVDTNVSTKVVIPLNSTQVTLDTSVAVTGVDKGLHFFHCRFRQTDSQYSVHYTQPFLRLANANDTGAKSIAGYEYWFDTAYSARVTDTVTSRGVGVHEITDLNTSFLPKGLHTFHLRFRENNNSWTTTLSKMVIKMADATDTGSAKIVGYEYWFDTAFSARVVDTVTSSAQGIHEIKGLENIALKDGVHQFYIRFRQNNNSWTTTLSSIVLTRKVKTGNSSFNSVTAVRYWLDTAVSKMDTLQLYSNQQQAFIFQQLDMSNYDTGDHYLYMQFKDAAGYWSSIIVDSFYQLGRPRIDDYTPKVGGNIGFVTMTIHGSGFFKNTIVRLTRSGYADIVVPDTMMGIHKGTRINATFDLRGKDTGLYNLVIEVPNDTTMTIVNGFKVVTGSPAEPWADVIGPTNIRPNTWNTYTVTYGNRGNVDALGVPVYIIIGNDTMLDHSINIKYASIEDSLLASLADDIPDYLIIDSLFNSPYPAIVYPLYIPYIKPNTTKTITIQIKKSNTSPIELYAFASNTYYTNPFKPGVIACNSLALLEAAKKTVNINPIPNWQSCQEHAMDGALSYAKNYLAGEDQLQYNTIYAAAGAFINCTAIPVVSMTRNAIVAELYIAANITHQLWGIGKDLWDKHNDCKEQFEENNRRDTKSPGKVTSSSIQKSVPVNVIQSIDPNAKYGPYGSGLNRYITEGSPFAYIINFENDSSATAAAQTVRIVDTLDKTVFNLNSFALGHIQLADTVVDIPNGVSDYTTYIDLRPRGNDVIVKLHAGIDISSGVATWFFQTLDPATMQPTTDPLAGFVPPNINSPEGEGGVFFTIDLNDNLPNNAVISNKAYIYFDNNAPIATDPWENTVDIIKPHSKVNPLPVFTEDTLVNVSWGGTDTSSGIEHYSIYVSENGKPYELWLHETPNTSGLFIGKLDSVYTFYSIATDTAGNIEDAPSKFDARTHLVPVGVESIVDSTYEISVHPNPSTGVFTLKGSGLSSNVKVKVSNILGQSIMSYSWLTDNGLINKQINIEGEPSGVYTISIEQEGSVNIIKIIKE